MPWVPIYSFRINFNGSWLQRVVCDSWRNSLVYCLNCCLRPIDYEGESVMAQKSRQWLIVRYCSRNFLEGLRKAWMKVRQAGFRTEIRTNDSSNTKKVCHDQYFIWNWFVWYLTLLSLRTWIIYVVSYSTV